MPWFNFDNDIQLSDADYEKLKKQLKDDLFEELFQELKHKFDTEFYHNRELISRNMHSDIPTLGITKDLNKEFPTVDLSKEYKIENNLKDILSKRGVLHSKLAKIIGISEKSLSLIISGKTTPSVDTLWKIANALQIKPDDIFRLVEVES